MDKSSRLDIPLDEQRRMWNQWNADHREWTRGEGSKRQAELVCRWLDALGRRNLDIIEVGCGAGWMCERLQHYGKVVATDLADDVLARARLRFPDVQFVAGDFLGLGVPRSSFDVAISLEVLSHVVDQAAFISKLSHILRPGGLMMLATQNRPILERWSAIGPPSPGQVRRWVDARVLRRMLQPAFEVLTLTSVVPAGDQGILRLVNSAKLNRALGMVCGSKGLTRLKESMLLGSTLMVLARRPE